MSALKWRSKAGELGSLELELELQLEGFCEGFKYPAPVKQFLWFSKWGRHHVNFISCTIQMDASQSPGEFWWEFLVGGGRYFSVCVIVFYYT